MRRALLILLIAALAAAGLALGAGSWLLYTEGGLAWALGRVQHATEGALQLETARGTLAHGATIHRVLYADAARTIEARDVSVRVSLRSLLTLAPHITALRCEELIIDLTPSDSPLRPPVTLALPVPVRIDEATLPRIVLGKGDAPFVITDLSVVYEGDSAAHRVRALSLAVGGVGLKGNATVGAVRPFQVEAAVTAHSAAHPAAHVDAKLSGTLEALRIAASSDAAGARATLEAAVAPFNPRPLERLAARLEGVDLKAFDARLPRTSIQGSAALASTGELLQGTVELENALNGLYDRERLPLKSLRSSVRTDMKALQFTTLNADLGPGGALVGSGTLALNRAALSMRADRLNLAGLHGKLRRTRLNGRIDVAATMEVQSISAALAEGPLLLDFDARRAGALVELNHARARARGGEARAHGHITFAGAQPFAVEGNFKGFDPAAWGDFPAGTVSGRISAKGTLANRIFSAELALEPSRLRGAALTGHGRAEMKGERITANVDIDFGGNRLQAQGAFGNTTDALAVVIDAPRLTIIDPRLTGRLTGTVQLAGTWQAPGAKFDLSGKELAYADQWRAGSISARGIYARAPEGPLELAAVATGISGPAWRIDRGNIDIKGTRVKHTVAINARGSSLDLTARAVGGWQTVRGWAGTVHEIVNRGSVPVVLEAPFAIEAGAERLQLGAVKAQILGGRLDVRGARFEANRMTSEGRFDAIPVRTILALAGVPPDTGGTLSLSGTWSLATTPRWNGTLSMRRDAGDVALGAGNVLPLGLETLTLDARVIDDRIEYRGALRSKVATGNLEGTLLPVNAGSAPRIAATSPLRLSGNIEVSRLAALGEFTDATVRFDGRAKAAFTARGTLREPLFTGTLEASDLSVAQPPEGVDLRGGTLHAELAEREIQVRSFVIRGGEGTFKASGVLAQGASRRAALDWQAERLTLLNRPDRRLVVTGKGNATLEGTKLALTGEVRADSGHIELRSNQLPALGEDVVIIGRKRDAAERSRLQGATLDLTLDFGDQFRLSGRGLDTTLAGRARVQTNAVGNLIAKGEVRTVRGVYHAFGQRLELERGRLIFDGSIEDPRLDIRAMRKRQQVEAGVEIQGTVRSPFVRIVSEPALPENEALSWLVLGHGSRDASSGDLSMLPLAAAALLNQDQSNGGIAGRFGLDTIGMRRDAVAGQIIAVGKRVTDDLYVVYEQGMGNAAQALKLEYNLGRRWLVRAEAGTASAIGLFFRWAFD
ncbi:MAG TPA: translocation/assembly module TamB domain-containing protein [Burkholderiales bacterium]|nr:translocation/assembly module TamB domain-containing protein [Burkholderiales bacterium]